MRWRYKTWVKTFKHTINLGLLARPNHGLILDLTHKKSDKKLNFSIMSCSYSKISLITILYEEYHILEEDYKDRQVLKPWKKNLKQQIKYINKKHTSSYE